jgi:uncharacterized protein (TIGR03435 family)
VRLPASIVFAALCCRSVLAQSAEIHTSGPNTIPEMRSRFFRGRYEFRNATLVDLIRTAWDVDADKVFGGPEWLDIRRYDLIAQAPADSNPEALKTMLKGLLADRFHVVARKETRAIQAWVMTAGKTPQLKAAERSTDETGCTVQQSNAPPEPVMYACRDMTMEAFAKAIPGMRGASRYLFSYPVVDRTGLQGTWNYSVKWSLAAGETITIFEAFEKQLGLKLSLARIPTPVVVVESVNEKPIGVTERPPVHFEFEVADIKPDASNLTGSYVSIRPGGSVTISMTLKGLIAEAWGDMKPDRIVGGMKSLDVTRFVVVAKAHTEEEPQAGWRGAVWNGVDVDSMRMMLRALLVDRFGLAAHNEDRLVSGYALVAAKPKLRKADPSNRPGCREGPGADGKDPRLANPVASRLITCRNMTPAQFASELNNELHGFPPIADATGIAGRYDMTVNFTPPAALQNTGVPVGGDAGASEPDGTISLFEALSRQLGLKLESRKVMAPVLVIDHVNQMPTEN